MKIEREAYIEKLKSKRENGRIKIITGIRRCGKSYLLNVLYREYLISTGIVEEQILFLALDDDANAKYRNPIKLAEYIRQSVENKETQYYVLLDEIQKVAEIHNPYLPDDAEAKIGFVDVLLGLKNLPNVDIYVTGSNSKMLSSDIVTEFRDRGDEIRVHPLTYSEFHAAYKSDMRHVWREFVTYGGMPYVMQLESHDEKAKYLQDLFKLTYLKDVVERNRIRADLSTLDDLLNYVASAVGSLTNPTRLANTFQSVKKLKIKSNTIASYLDYFVDAFILEKSYRYDIKGRSYIDTPLKYYFTDVGLRNARLNFRQQEENHIMENILYNELIARGFSVDVGIVEYNVVDENGTKKRTQLEVDFVVNMINRRYYIQSALTVGNEEKRLQEINSLNRIDDSYMKIVVVRDDILPWIDERGIQYINIQDFLLEKIDELV